MEFELFHKFFFNAKAGAFSKVTAREVFDSQITLTDLEAEMVINYFGNTSIQIGSVTSNPNKAKKQFVLFPDNRKIELNLIYPKSNKSELRLYLSIKAGFKPTSDKVWFLFIDQLNNLNIGALSEAEWNLIGQADEQDANYQDEIALLPEKTIDTSVIPESKIEKRIISGREVYIRNSIFGKVRFQINGYKCEVDPLHKTFISERDKNPFLESHHLIPMNFQGKILLPLDDIKNLVGLCPNCHRGIHHGIQEHKASLLNSILKNRPAFHYFTKADIYSFYNCYSFES